MDGAGVPFTGIATNNTGSAKEKKILLGSCYTRFLTPPLEEVANGKVQTERVQEFNYLEYLAVFRQATKDLGPYAAPCRARRGEPSMDRAKNWRTATGVHRRSRWAALSNIARCEKPARLAAS